MSRLIPSVMLLAGLAGCAGGSAQPSPEVSRLITQLHADDLNQRTDAAMKLMRFGPAASEAVPALVENLGPGRGKAQMLNVSATNALLRIGPRAAVPALIAAVQGEDRDVAYGAAFTLGGFGAAARPAVPVLLAALDDPAVRPAAHTALQMIGEES